MMDQGTTNPSPNAKPASQQQQAQFDLLLGRSRQIMGEAAQEWLSTLEKDPVQGAVTLGTQTLRSLAQASEKAGQPVDPTVLINVGVQLVKDVAAVANTAGLVPDDKLPEYLQEVMSQSMAQYLRMDADEGMLSGADKQRAEGIVQQAGMQPGAQQGAMPMGKGMQMATEGGMPGDGPGMDDMREDAQAPMEHPEEEDPQNPGMLARMQRMKGRR